MRLEPDNRWIDCGRLGDALEINALNVYNSQLYGGTIPRAEVFRYNPMAVPGVPVEALPPEHKPQQRVRRLAPPPEPGSPAWTSVRRFLDPAGYEFQTPNEWARLARVNRSAWFGVPDTLKGGHQTGGVNWRSPTSDFA